MELYQKIEALIGLTMEPYPAEQEAVLLLLERVSEAQRIATMQAGRGWMGSCGCMLRSTPQLLPSYRTRHPQRGRTSEPYFLCPPFPPFPLPPQRRPTLPVDRPLKTPFCPVRRR